jgi:hypothetical protein
MPQEKSLAVLMLPERPVRVSVLAISRLMASNLLDRTTIKSGSTLASFFLFSAIKSTSTDFIQELYLFHKFNLK